MDEIVILNHGILEEVEKENLDNEAFKDKIINMLRGRGLVYRTLMTSFRLGNAYGANISDLLPPAYAAY